MGSSGRSTGATSDFEDDVRRVETIEWKDATSNKTLANTFTYLSFFTPKYSYSVNRWRVESGSTAWIYTTGAGVRLSLYTVAADGAGTLVARSAVSTAAFLAASTEYTFDLATAGGYPSSYDLVVGTRYAFGLSIDWAGTVGSVPGLQTAGAAAVRFSRRRKSGRLAAADPPVSFVAGGITDTALAPFYAAMINTADSGT